MTLTNRFYMLENNCLRLATDLEKGPQIGLPEQMRLPLAAHLHDLHDIMRIISQMWAQVIQHTVLVGVDPVRYNGRIAAIVSFSPWYVSADAR